MQTISHEPLLMRTCGLQPPHTSRNLVNMSLVVSDLKSGIKYFARKARVVGDPNILQPLMFILQTTCTYFEETMHPAFTPHLTIWPTVEIASFKTSSNHLEHPYLYYKNLEPWLCDETHYLKVMGSHPSIIHWMDIFTFAVKIGLFV